jgi:UDP-N-acetylmuramoyl-tripeptide--D-alanyl-D-alanine ligase
VALAAQREGVEPPNAVALDSTSAALADLRAWVRPGDVVLVKGSRVAGLEALAEALRTPEGAGP